MDPLLEQAADIERATRRPRPSCASWCALARAHRAHLDHMAVFAQERHAIEHEPEWEDVRASRDAFEAILARRLAAVGLTDRLAHFALLGMVNHTATWLKPGGRLTARADRRRLLRHAAASDPPRDQPRTSAPSARSGPRGRGPSLHSPAPRPPPDRRSSSTACSSTSSTTGSPATSRSARCCRSRPIAHVLEIKGLAGRTRAIRRRGVGARAPAGRDRAGASAPALRKLTLRVLGHNAAARALYAACGFEVEGVLRELFLLDGRYVDDVLMALDLTTLAVGLTAHQRRRDGLELRSGATAAPRRGALRVTRRTRNARRLPDSGSAAGELRVAPIRTRSSPRASRAATCHAHAALDHLRAAQHRDRSPGSCARYESFRVPPNTGRPS